MHHTHNEAIAAQVIVGLGRPGHSLILQDSRVNLAIVDAHAANEVVEQLLKLADTSRYLHKVARVILITECHTMLCLCHYTIYRVLIREIEGPKGRTGKIFSKTLKVGMNTRVKVKAAYILLVQGKGYYQVEDSLQLVVLLVEFMVMFKQQLEER